MTGLNKQANEQAELQPSFWQDVNLVHVCAVQRSAGWGTVRFSKNCKTKKRIYWKVRAYASTQKDTIQYNDSLFNDTPESGTISVLKPVINYLMKPLYLLWYNLIFRQRLAFWKQRCQQSATIRNDTASSDRYVPDFALNLRWCYH